MRLIVLVTSGRGEAGLHNAPAAPAAATRLENSPNTAEPLPVIAAWDAPAFRSALTRRTI
ncbi:MAG TPA: hypothetical protein VKH42_03740 [Vicinamibacterales bacterium]|nr:hypothetical protein [Vicinamibacterales bacterium]